MMLSAPTASTQKRSTGAQFMPLVVMAKFRLTYSLGVSDKAGRLVRGAYGLPVVQPVQPDPAQPRRVLGEDEIPEVLVRLGIALCLPRFAHRTTTRTAAAIFASSGSRYSSIGWL